MGNICCGGSDQNQPPANPNRLSSSVMYSVAGPNRKINPNNPAENHTKIVLVGDTGAGKSCMISNYLNNNYDEHYVPTVLDVYQGQKSVNRTTMELEIHDTAGDENLARNRAI